MLLATLVGRGDLQHSVAGILIRSSGTVIFMFRFQHFPQESQLPTIAAPKLP